MSDVIKVYAPKIIPGEIWELKDGQGDIRIEKVCEHLIGFSFLSNGVKAVLTPKTLLEDYQLFIPF